MNDFKRRISDMLVIFALIAMCIALMAFPEAVSGAAINSVNLCLYMIIPSLFPFFVVASLASETGISMRLGKNLSGIMRPLFGISGSCAVPLILGLIGGYPVGAKAACALYDSGGCTKEELGRLMLFCNNSGPAFIFGIVGSYLFGSLKIGAVIFIVHICTSLAIGVGTKMIFGNVKTLGPVAEHGDKHRRSFSLCFVNSVTSSVGSIINISGFIIFFGVLSGILTTIGFFPSLSSFIGQRILGGNISLASSLINGMLELTRGISALSLSFCTVPEAAAAASLLLGCGGVSVIFQIFSVSDGRDYSRPCVLLAKLLHGAAACAVSYLIFTLSPAQDITAMAVGSVPVSYMSAMRFILPVFLIVCMAAVIFNAVLSKNSSGKI